MIMLFSRSFGLFALSFIIQALGNNFNSGSEEALVYDSMKYIGREEQYMGLYGRLNIILEVSQGIATVAGGILAEYSYFWCYGACVAIGLLSLLPVLLMTEAPYSRQGEKQTGIGELAASHFRESFRILQSDVRILKIILYYSIIFAAQTLLFFYSQQYFYSLGYNKIRISLILLIMGAASCLGAFMSDKIYAQYKRKVVFAASAVIAVSMICYGFENAAVSAAALSAAGFCNSVLYPVQSDSLNRLIPSDQRATLISVNSLFFSVAMILMFPTAGMMADQWGLTKVLAAIGVFILLFAAVCTVVETGRSRRR